MVACLYIPSFSAWVFEETHRHEPIIVVSGGRVVSVSKSALRIGVQCGISAERASALCPSGRIHLRDYDREVAAWEQVVNRVHAITPFIKYAPPPFLFFTADEAIRGLAKDLRACAGISRHASIARLAAIKAAPGNTLFVREHAVPHFLKRFPVELLSDWGFEEELSELLTLFGFPTLGDAAALSKKHLRAQFGPPGEALHAIIHPEKEMAIPLFRPPRTLTAYYDFDQLAQEPRDLIPALEELVGKCHRQMENHWCQRLRVSIQNFGQATPIHAYRVLQKPTDSLKGLVVNANLLLHRLMHRGMEVEHLAVELGALKVKRSTQTSLFRFRPAVSKAVAVVHRRFPGILQRAIVQPGVLFAEEEVRMEAFDKDLKESVGGIRKAS